MTRHFRTLIAAIQIDDDSDLRFTAHAVTVARKALTEAGFTVDEMRNVHNETGELPPRTEEIPW